MGGFKGQQDGARGWQRECTDSGTAEDRGVEGKVARARLCGLTGAPGQSGKRESISAAWRLALDFPGSRRSVIHQTPVQACSSCVGWPLGQEKGPNRPQFCKMGPPSSPSSCRWGFLHSLSGLGACSQMWVYRGLMVWAAWVVPSLQHGWGAQCPKGPGG